MTTETRRSSLGRKLLSGSVLRLGNLIAAAASSFFLMPFMVYHLGDRIYGFWALAAAFIGYYGLLDFGMSSAVSQYICIAIGRQDFSECRVVFNTALRIQSILGSIALLATAAIAIATPWFCKNPADAHIFWKVIAILGVNAALGFPARAYGGLLDAQLRFDIQSWLGILGVALRTGLIVVAVVMGGGLLSLAWMTSIATVLTIALQVWFARRVAPWARIYNAPINSTRTRSLVSYSAYTFVATIADTLRLQIDPVVISGFIGLSAVTHYRVAALFTGFYMNTIIAATSTFQPVLSRLHGAENRVGIEKLFSFLTKVSVCLSIPVCLGLIGWGKPFIARWMGTKYSDAYLPLVVLSIAVFLDVCQAPSIYLAYATFKHRFYTYANLAEGIINLGFSIALAKPLGILGVALGTLIGGFLIRVIVQPWWVCKAAGLAYLSYMRFLGKTLVSTIGIMGAAMALTEWLIKPTYVSMAGTAACATLIYAAGTWLIVFNRSDREMILTSLMRRSQMLNEPMVANVALE